jgi:hypothetical protein
LHRLSVFKDESLKQLPDEPLATRLPAQTHLFPDFVADVDFVRPPVNADVIVHGNCHQKAVSGMKGETTLLDKLGGDGSFLTQDAAVRPVPLALTWSTTNCRWLSVRAKYSP